MNIGELLRTAIEHSSYTPKEVGRVVGLGENTIYRWMASPNLDLKAIMRIHKAVPEIHMKDIFVALEEKYGHELPENPYREGGPVTSETSKEDDGDDGIQIMIDLKKYQGYRIPEGFVDNVKRMLEDAQEDYEKKDKKKKK